MQKRQLGKDGPEVSVICLGAWPLGGGMGAIPDDQAIATIHASIDAGANFIDTAEGYRTSESVLGKALKDRRNDVVARLFIDFLQTEPAQAILARHGFSGAG